PPLHLYLGAALALMTAVAIAPAAAGDDPPKDPWHLWLFRFEFDNDNFVGSDDAFSAGWSFQVHSRLMDQWGGGLDKWVRHVPGLGDDGVGGRVVRRGAGLTQIILTPHDVSIETPQPDDVPWAGILAGTGSWSSNDNLRMAAIQIYFGCMGPCSGGEQVQKFVHEDLGLGTPPAGWDNQLAQRWLWNLNYEYRHKLVRSDEAKYVPGRFAADLAAAGMAGVGNAATLARAGLEFRFGWGLPMGFTKIPDFAPLGVVTDPVYLDPLKPIQDLYRWRAYFNINARYTWFDQLAPFEENDTVNGGVHPELSPIPGERQALFGMHLVRVPVGFHVTYFYYLDSEELSSGRDWVNFTFEYRF
ncbi:MAG TPA: lipid A-modifier LpxR family protein, partial [Candidatus Cryosericum sp.]|nr:lipid A-modifier LpxR family protein [Candidatus Cryosericum sp.]